jgi:hypothetical protein
LISPNRFVISPMSVSTVASAAAAAADASRNGSGSASASSSSSPHKYAEGLIVWSIGGGGGDAPKPGLANAKGEAALFKEPRGICYDPKRDRLIVADTGKRHRQR